jgi:hypothetical protein
MIYTDSRYANGDIFRAYNAKSESYEVTVFRNFPTESTDYFLYVWKEGDRVDLVSKGFLGTAALWWRIMDYNPELLNPHTIPVGTTVRIPNVT